MKDDPHAMTMAGVNGTDAVFHVEATRAVFKICIILLSSKKGPEDRRKASHL